MRDAALLSRLDLLNDLVSKEFHLTEAPFLWSTFLFRHLATHLTSNDEAYTREKDNSAEMAPISLRVT